MCLCLSQCPTRREQFINTFDDDGDREGASWIDSGPHPHYGMNTVPGAFSGLLSEFCLQTLAYLFND